jgi:hypothetical protein
LHRKQQHDLHLELTRNEDESGEEGEKRRERLTQRLKVVSRVIDVVHQLNMSHDAFKEA